MLLFAAVATVPLEANPNLKRITAALQHRFFLRVHMTAMLTATILVGLATNLVLYRIHLNIFAIRYGVAVITAYAAFIGCIKLWLAYVEYRGRRQSGSSGGDDWFNCVNFSSSGSSGSGSSSGSSVSFSSGGGKFGGGGATGGWASEASAQPAPMVVVPPPSSKGGSSSSSSSSSKSGGGGGGSDDLGELILVLLILALVIVVIASFVWIVWAAPTILGEVVFNAVLAGALAHHAHRATCGDWIGSVLKKTGIPFVLILGLSIAVGWWAQHICPTALRLRDAFPCVQSQYRQ